MQVDQSTRYIWRDFKAGQLSRAFSELVRRTGNDPATAQFRLRESLPDGTSIGRRVTVEDLQTVCDPGQGLSFSHEVGGDHLYLSLSRADDTTLNLFVSCSSIESLEIGRGAFEETLSLAVAPPSPEADGGVIDSILRRLDEVEERLGAPTRRLRCFLSYRFSPTSEIPALRIKTFLSLLDVDVLTGARYEPRKVSDKVLSRLREPLDFIVLLITADSGESMWTRDEIGTALATNLPLIPLIEKGADFSPGLFADLEFVEFDVNHVGDTFLKLLEAIQFIREQRAAIPPGDPAVSDGRAVQSGVAADAARRHR